MSLAIYCVNANADQPAATGEQTQGGFDRLNLSAPEVQRPAPSRAQNPSQGQSQNAAFDKPQRDVNATTATS